jgi:hypothetical protein
MTHFPAQIAIQRFRALPLVESESAPILLGFTAPYNQSAGKVTRRQTIV